ncbi:HPr family phosphocarrier protein [Novosphingobium mangrovi (ex Huang et al. 2023)]|uniref:HPr family phosphocarrier protein n=1 Tax=Novosphingobium mangrovi (ex Huang et al. 2023) TaxID=2976432 RepID=A0ABT2I3K0_9SPHN|nr:HPr family phosphocarrier protein [Novosphingobium mangrovi (ex Huang et al. 2023)]MCT2399384.1 HPr family phosphocarrier protein [Novosphingobium mangrovi (ex Huang et al. 2023)]
MIECREAVLIVNKRGLHARASAKFVNNVAELPPGVTVIVSKDGASASGNSILGLMMLGAAKGDTIEIGCSGNGAENALAALSTLVRDGFGEE